MLQCTKVIRGILILLFALATLLTASAGETDQLTHRAWMLGCDGSLTQLSDSKQSFNDWVNQQLEKGVQELNKGAHSDRHFSEDPLDVFAEIFLGLMPELITPIEIHFLKNLRSIPFHKPLFGIYRHATPRDMGPVGFSAPIFPTLKFDGILLGVDKLGHFFAQGFEYMSKYRDEKLTSWGQSEEELLESVRTLGAESESGIYGFKTTGIFSYADLAANWQGFQFYRALLDGPNPYIKRDETGRWVLARRFDFADYVTDDWDEVLNPNLYWDKTFEKKMQREYRRHCHEFLRNPTLFLNRTGRTIGVRYTPNDTAEQERRSQQHRNRIEVLCAGIY